MSDILDTARELLDLLARPDKWADDGLSTHDIAKVCRAFIARTEALRELVDCDNTPVDFGVDAEVDSFAERYQRAWEAARKALAEEP